MLTQAAWKSCPHLQQRTLASPTQETSHSGQMPATILVWRVALDGLEGAVSAKLGAAASAQAFWSKTNAFADEWRCSLARRPGASADVTSMSQLAHITGIILKS